MFGIDYDRLEEMVHRMEAVAASMEASSKRVEEAVDNWNESVDDLNHVTGPINIPLTVHLDSKKIYEVTRRYSEDERSRQ